MMIMIGSLALMGFPFTTGFYSKDVILELAYSNYYFEGVFAYGLGVLAAFCTAFYSFRLIYLTFLSETNSRKDIMKQVHDAPILMSIPLVILCFGSIFVGYIFKDMFIGMGTDFWGNSIYSFNYLNDVLVLESEFLNASIKNIPVVISVIGGLLALITYNYYPKMYYVGNKPYLLKEIYVFFNKKWLFDLIYNHYIVRKVLDFGYNTTFKKLDRGFIELIGPTGIVRIMMILAEKVSAFQSGYIYHYVFVIVLGLLFIIITVCGLISKVYLGLGVVFTGTILYLLTNNLTREEKNSY